MFVSRLPTLGSSEVASIEIAFTEVITEQINRQKIQCKIYDNALDFIDCGRAATWRLFKGHGVNCTIPGLEELGPGLFPIYLDIKYKNNRKVFMPNCCY